LDIATLNREARDFTKQMKKVKEQAAPADFPWYPWGTLYNFGHLDNTLKGTNRDLSTLIDGAPIADIGAADGELAFFMESKGLDVDVVDYGPTNYNTLRGVKLLKETMNSKVSIHERDIDTHFQMPRERYGLVFFLGILYHLKNPFYVLEQLARTSRYAIISTRIARYAADRKTNIDASPVAYLLDATESNNDATNYWIFSDAGLKRILHRSGWDVIDYHRLGDTKHSDPASNDHDERAFALIRSRHF
jgi:tRNA (mo5U34)-methyltransferase